MRNSIVLCLLVLIGLLLFTACDEKTYDLDDQAKDSITALHVDHSFFKDEQGRYFFLHGTNVSGSTKFPATDDPISYVGKPFPLEEADRNFKILRDMGFNGLRLLTTWEAIEPYASGEYDLDYLDYFEQIVAKANEYGIYVFIDMHQDFFSRWHCLYYNDGSDTPGIAPASIDSMQPPLNDVVRGDGAPRWVLALTLPEKNVYSDQWGLPRHMVADPRNTGDLLPLFWGINTFLSTDVGRSFATFFAGASVYPNYYVDGKNIQDYLQDSFTNAWLQVVQRVKDYPNVIGYDIINEPLGLYIAFTLYALLYQEAKSDPSGTLTQQQVEDCVDLALAEPLRRGLPLNIVNQWREILLNDASLPRTPAEFEEAGLPLDAADNDPHKPDILAALALNANFNRNYLQPFFAKVGAAIQQEDPEAIVIVESSLGMSDEEGIFGALITPMLAPEGIDQIAFAPHFYTDVYSVLGLAPNPDPRDFTIDEIQLRDYTVGILDAISLSAFSLGNPPVILGEFGTYFNLGGVEKAEATDYIVPAYIIDNYYDVLEENLVNRTIWTYSPENTPAYGDGWNKEDFSILGPNMTPRATDAYVRVTPRFTSGRLVSYKYNSPLGYYEPKPGVPTPIKEFIMTMEGLETSAPTEVTVPRSKYPDGFYVYVSDGRCTYDPVRQILYWYPADDDPDVQHTMRIRPPWADYGDSEWNFFFNGDQMLEGN